MTLPQRGPLLCMLLRPLRVAYITMAASMVTSFENALNVNNYCGKIAPTEHRARCKRAVVMATHSINGIYTTKSEHVRYIFKYTVCSGLAIYNVTNYTIKERLRKKRKSFVAIVYINKSIASI
jgi:hypothetical protein